MMKDKNIKIDIIHKSRIYRLFRPFYSGIGHVLMFHRVYDSNEFPINGGLKVSTDFLESVIQYFISKNIDIVTLDECQRRITSIRKSNRFVVFTFDDGYEDNYTNALPIFEKYNVPFSIFLSSGFPDNKIILWWYFLEEILMNNELIEFVDKGNQYRLNVTDQEEKEKAFWQVRRIIMEQRPEDIPGFFRKLFNKNDNELISLTKKFAMSWTQVKEISKHPLVTIGAHTINHKVLSKLDEQEVISEIYDSIQVIEQYIEKPVLYFAYPFGIPSTVSSREIEIASRSNLKMAFTTERSNIFAYHASNLFALPRIEITEKWTNAHFDLFINGFTTFMNKIKR